MFRSTAILGLAVALLMAGALPAVDVVEGAKAVAVCLAAVRSAREGRPVAVGLGLGGPEVDNPPELFQAAFDAARAAGLASLPHAGETVGPESVWSAIRELGAERLGHGVRVVEDLDVVKLAKGTGAMVCVDGVGYVPHRLVDVKDLDVDFYVFSAYKAFGPHLGIVLKKDLIVTAEGAPQMPLAVGRLAGP